MSIVDDEELLDGLDSTHAYIGQCCLKDGVKVYSYGVWLVDSEPLNFVSGDRFGQPDRELDERGAGSSSLLVETVSVKEPLNLGSSGMRQG